MRNAGLTRLFFLIYMVTSCTSNNFEPVDSENAVYKNSKGQCFISQCGNCRDGGCCVVIVPCPGTTTASPEERSRVHKNSRGQCFYRTCKNCVDGGCCAILVPCNE